jgi:hypothetical protein
LQVDADDLAEDTFRSSLKSEHHINPPYLQSSKGEEKKTRGKKGDIGESLMLMQKSAQEQESYVFACFDVSFCLAAALMTMYLVRVVSQTQTFAPRQHDC